MAIRRAAKRLESDKASARKVKRVKEMLFNKSDPGRRRQEGRLALRTEARI